MSKNKFLILDGNNALYRAYYKFNNLKTSKGINSGVIYGFPYILGSLIKSHLPDDVIVVFDGGRDKKRMELSPDYKGSRKPKAGFDKDDFHRQRDEVIKVLHILGIKVVYQRDKEADDLIWLIARRLKRYMQVVIVSSDKDFNQLISKNVSIWNPKLDKRVTHKNCKELVGYEPHQCVDYLTFVGDESDNIKGVPGIGHKRATDFIELGESIESYLVSSNKELKGFEKSKLEPVFLINRKLIGIRLFVRKYMSLRDATISIPKKLNHKELNFFCSKYEINSFSKPSFTHAFEKLLKNNKNNTLCQKFLSSVPVVSVKQH